MQFLLFANMGSLRDLPIIWLSTYMLGTSVVCLPDPQRMKTPALLKILLQNKNEQTPRISVFLCTVTSVRNKLDMLMLGALRFVFHI